MAKFVGNELDEINSITTIYDTFINNIRKKVLESGSFQKFIKNIASDFMTKNDIKLNTNIVGKQIIFNKKTEDAIFDFFNLDQNDVKTTVLNSAYFKKFGKELALTDQIVVAIPLILGSLEYKRINKIDESQFLFLFAHFKPYSSRESFFVKYGVDEGRMLYTVERTLTDRFDLKKYATVLAALTKRSESSWKNYIEPVKSSEKLTDRDIHIIYNSGIATRVNDFLGKIFEKYKENVGKSLDFENPVQSVYDKDTDSMEISSADIESDIAVKIKLVNNIMNTVSKDAVDKESLVRACRSAFGSNGQSNVAKLEFAISEIVDNMFDDLFNFFNSLIGAFLTDVSLGRKIEINEIRSPLFMRIGIEILTGKKSHLVNKDMVYARNKFNEMLELYLDGYNEKGNTYKYTMKKALASYWIFLIAKVSKRG